MYQSSMSGPPIREEGQFSQHTAYNNQQSRQNNPYNNPYYNPPSQQPLQEHTNMPRVVTEQHPQHQMMTHNIIRGTGEQNQMFVNSNINYPEGGHHQTGMLQHSVRSMSPPPMNNTGYIGHYESTTNINVHVDAAFQAGLVRADWDPLRDIFRNTEWHGNEEIGHVLPRDTKERVVARILHTIAKSWRIANQRDVNPTGMGSFQTEIRAAANKFLKRFGFGRKGTRGTLQAHHLPMYQPDTRYTLLRFEKNILNLKNSNRSAELLFWMITEDERMLQHIQSWYAEPGSNRQQLPTLSMAPSPQGGRSQQMQYKRKREEIVKRRCKHGERCWSKNCKFEHPQTRQLQQIKQPPPTKIDEGGLSTNLLQQFNDTRIQPITDDEEETQTKQEETEQKQTILTATSKRQLTEGELRQKEIVAALEKKKREKERKEKLAMEQERKKKEKEEEEKRKKEEEEKEKKRKEEEERRQQQQLQQRKTDKIVATLILNTDKSLEKIKVSDNMLKTLSTMDTGELKQELLNEISEEKEGIRMIHTSQENLENIVDREEYLNTTQQPTHLIFIPVSATATAIITRECDNIWPEQDEDRDIDYNNEEKLIKLAQRITAKYWMSCLITKDLLLKEVLKVREYGKKYSETHFTAIEYVKLALDTWKTEQQSKTQAFGDTEIYEDKSE